MQETFDVVVIGSGAGGGPITMRLAESGFRVLVLEKGPEYDRSQYVHDEIGISRRGFFVPSLDDDPHTVMWGNAKVSQKTEMGWTAQCVGGGTVHFSGFAYRLHPDDFQMHTKYGALVDWPFSYEELEPYYTKVEEEIGVSGDAEANPFEPPRSKPYPLPPVQVHPFREELERASRELGFHPFPTPRAILSRPYRGRMACVYCDFCGSFGCEVGAKSSTQEALLPRAVATGRCEIRPRSMVHRVLAKDGRATGVLYFDAAGMEHFVGARFVIVSANAVESARLLLLSEIGNDQVGKNLQFSLNAGGGATYRFAKQKPREELLRVRQPSFLGPSLQDFYFLKDLAIPKGGTIQFIIPHPAPISRAWRATGGHQARWGASLKKLLRENFWDGRTIEFEAFVDFLPNPGTFVDLDPEVRDRWGLPVARLHIRQVEHHFQAGKIVQAKGLDVLRASGADEVHAHRLGIVAGHLLEGSCRAGKDPDNSALDPTCRLWDLENLYVVDGSFMPTSGGVPCTLTIMANSFRVADAIVEKARKA